MKRASDFVGYKVVATDAVVDAGRAAGGAFHAGGKGQFTGGFPRHDQDAAGHAAGYRWRPPGFQRAQRGAARWPVHTTAGSGERRQAEYPQRAAAPGYKGASVRSSKPKTFV